MTQPRICVAACLLLLTLLAAGCGDSGGSGPGADGGHVPCHPDQVALCDLHASCELLQDVPVCTCQPGYEGNGVACVDIDECARGTDACGAAAECVDTDGGYRCECPAGYTDTGSTCMDDDECALGTDDCHANAFCTNTPGAYACSCSEGYSGDGVTCTIDPATFVSDLSSTPIALDVNGIGTYLADGMGRLAVEVEFVSSPGNYPGRVERVPTGWRVHNLRLRNIRPGPSTLSALQGWAMTSIPTNVSLTLQGPGSEVFVLRLAGAVTASADTSVTDGRMAELVLAIDDVIVTAHTPASATTGAPTSTVVEFSGVACVPVMPPEDIDEALPFTAGPLRLRELGAYAVPGLGNSIAFVTWMDGARDELDMVGDISRHDLSQVHRNPSGIEIDRTNCFQAFPALLYYFNPTRPYGTTHLVDIEIAIEWCEDA